MAAQRRPVTPGMFAELTADLRAELAAATPEHRAALLARPRRALPAAFTGRSWTRHHVGSLREIAELTGTKYATLRVYAWRGGQDRAEGSETHRSMPAQAPTGGWITGQLALWYATRDEARAKGQRRRWPSHERYYPQLRAILQREGQTPSQRALALELGVSPSDRRLIRALLREIGAPPPPRTTDGDALPFLAGLAQRSGRRLNREQVAAALDAAGLHMSAVRASRLYVKAGGRLIDLTPSSDDTPSALESLRWDGLVTQAQIARAFGVSDGAVTQARDLGHIKPAKWVNGKPLYDPAQITSRKDMRAGPVMRGHPLAAEDEEMGPK